MSFRIPVMWVVDSGDVRHAHCHSASSWRSLPSALDLFTDISSFLSTVGVLYDYMETCLCLRGTYTPSSTIHLKSKSAISKSEIYSVTFGFFFVISDYLLQGSILVSIQWYSGHMYLPPTLLISLTLMCL